MAAGGNGSDGLRRDRLIWQVWLLGYRFRDWLDWIMGEYSWFCRYVAPWGIWFGSFAKKKKSYSHIEDFVTNQRRFLPQYHVTVHKDIYRNGRSFACFPGADDSPPRAPNCTLPHDRAWWVRYDNTLRDANIAVADNKWSTCLWRYRSLLYKLRNAVQSPTHGIGWFNV